MRQYILPKETNRHQFKGLKITEKFLDENPDAIFVFGDNLYREGKGGAALLRDHPQSYGFITKKAPNLKTESFYQPEEYWPVFHFELAKLQQLIIGSPEDYFLVSQLGSGLANRYEIFENVIRPSIGVLHAHNNVAFLYAQPIPYYPGA